MPHANKPKDWIIIGIGGVTCGGKTTLANQIGKCFYPSYLMHQDTYFYPDDHPAHVKCEGMDHNNYDIMSSLDMARMHSDVLKVLNDNIGDIPVKVTSKATPGEVSYTHPNKKVLIVEGFCILNYKAIADLCDIKYFITLEYGDCLARRVYRTYIPPDVPGYFEKCVWPNYLLYKQQLETDSSVSYLDGMQGDHKDVAVENLKQYGFVTVKSS